MSVTLYYDACLPRRVAVEQHPEDLQPAVAGRGPAVGQRVAQVQGTRELLLCRGRVFFFFVLFTCI